MDSGSSSKAKMTAQKSDTICNLDECVKIAEMSASKLVDDSLQPDPTPYYKPVNIQYKIANEGFPKFCKLPAELRSKVWQDAMPPYGVFTALMLGREEPRPQQPPPPAILAFRVVYRLEPVPRDQQDDELRTRLDTMRAIQRTSSEAASEVQRAFPTTINCTGGKLRFNAEHDTLSLSDLQCIFASNSSKRFGRYSQGAIVFADNWHKIPRNMMFNSSSLLIPMCRVGWWIELPKGSTSYGAHNIQNVEGFMQFLADCTALRTFGFMYHRPCEDTALESLDRRRTNYQFLCFCYLAPIMKGSFYDDIWVSLGTLKDFVSGFQGLEALIHGLRPGQEVPKDWQGTRFGRPELQHLQIQAAISVGHAFKDRLKGMGGEASQQDLEHWEQMRFQAARQFGTNP